MKTPYRLIYSFTAFLGFCPCFVVRSILGLVSPSFRGLHWSKSAMIETIEDILISRY